MVYISYGMNRELFHSVPEEIAPLFGFEAIEVTCCHLVIQTSHSLFSDLGFLKGTLPTVLLNPGIFRKLC